MKQCVMTPRTFIVFHASGLYFRIANTGLSIDLNRPVLFSERNGYRKVRRIGRLALEVLR